MSLTFRSALALLRPTLRAGHWGPFIATTAVGLAIVVVPAAVSGRMATGTLVAVLRLAAVCSALGATFLLDDPAAPTTATVATPRLLRHLVRAAVVLPVLATAGGVVGATVTAVRYPGTTLPLGDLSIEAAALYATALALAAARMRTTGDGAAGPFAVAVLLLVTAVAILLPENLTPFPSPHDARWSRVHDQWTAVLAVAAVGYLCAALERVPWPTGRFRWRGGDRTA
jgi:hypothetical protein